jgi:hypothetical protein
MMQFMPLICFIVTGDTTHVAPHVPMVFQILAGDPSPAVRRLAGDIRKYVIKLPEGSIRDNLDYLLADRPTRPIVKKLNALQRENRELHSQVKRDLEAFKRKDRQERERLNGGFPNYEFYGPKLKKRVDG